MSTFTSTIPAAITTFQGYMTAAAAAVTSVPVSVYVGYSTPLSGMSNNFMMVGDYEEGVLWAPAETDWQSWSIQAKRRKEEYALYGTIRCWTGDPTDWQDPLNNAFTLIDALTEQIVSDPGAAGNLTGSGSWGRFGYRNIASGALTNTAGFGVVVGLELTVINALPQG